MGQTAAEIEYEIERQRHALTARIDRLERRVRDDVGATTGNVRNRASAAVDSVTSSAGKVASVAGTHAGSDTAVAHHPKSMVLGAAAGGFVVGLLSAREGDSEPSRDPEEFKRQWLDAYRRNGDGTHANGRREPGSEDKAEGREGLGSALVDVARGFVAAQAGGLMQSAMESIVDGFKSEEDREPGTRPNGGSRYASQSQRADPLPASTTPGLPAHRV